MSVFGAANGGYVGGAVAILNGKGRGQVSKVASVINPPPPPMPPPGPFPTDGCAVLNLKMMNLPFLKMMILPLKMTGHWIPGNNGRLV